MVPCSTLTPFLYNTTWLLFFVQPFTRYNLVLPNARSIQIDCVPFFIKTERKLACKSRKELFLTTDRNSRQIRDKSTHPHRTRVLIGRRQLWLWPRPRQCHRAFSKPWYFFFSIFYYNNPLSHLLSLPPFLKIYYFADSSALFTAFGSVSSFQ